MVRMILWILGAIGYGKETRVQWRKLKSSIVWIMLFIQNYCAEEGHVTINVATNPFLLDTIYLNQLLCNAGKLEMFKIRPGLDSIIFSSWSFNKRVIQKHNQYSPIISILLITYMTLSFSKHFIRQPAMINKQGKNWLLSDLTPAKFYWVTVTVMLKNH